MKKFFASVVIFLVAVMFVWSVLTINTSVTGVFNSSEYEMQNVDYGKIKNDTGLDIEALCKDNSFLKSYDTDKGFVIVLGNYAFNLNENLAGKAIVATKDYIDLGIQSFRNFVEGIMY